VALALTPPRSPLAPPPAELKVFEAVEKTPGLDAAIASLKDSRDKVRKTNQLIETIEVR
jgi:hypothetical protein